MPENHRPQGGGLTHTVEASREEGWGGQWAVSRERVQLYWLYAKSLWLSESTTKGSDGLYRSHVNTSRLIYFVWLRLLYRSPKVIMSSSSHVELFVRAGRDHKTLGGCPHCQRVFLALSVKAEYGPVTLSVTPVHLAKLPTGIQGAFSRLPAIRHDGETLTDVDEMLQYVDKLFPQPLMSCTCVAATEACQDVFSRYLVLSNTSNYLAVMLMLW